MASRFESKASTISATVSKRDFVEDPTSYDAVSIPLSEDETNHLDPNARGHGFDSKSHLENGCQNALSYEAIARDTLNGRSAENNLHDENILIASRLDISDFKVMKPSSNADLTRHQLVFNENGELSCSLSKHSKCYLVPSASISEKPIPQGSIAIPMYLIVEQSESMPVTNDVPIEQSRPVTYDLLWNSTTDSPSEPQSEWAVTSSEPFSLPGNNEAIAGDESELAGKKKKTKGKRLTFPPCQVCDGVSSGIHFGCYTCEACKNFFRRCLKRKSEENTGSKKSRNIFTCRANQNCDTTHGNAKINCSACRFQKCIELGMATEKVKKGRISYAQRTETIKQVRMLEGKDVIVSPNEASTRATSNDMSSTVSTALDVCEAMFSRNILKLQETCENVRVSEDLIDSLVQNMDKMQILGEEMSNAEVREARIKEHYEKYMTKVAMFGSMSGVPKDEYLNLLKNYGIDIDGQWDVFKEFALNLESVIGRYCTFAKQLPNFAKLSLTDQISLLKHTHCDFFILMLHKTYKPEYNIFVELNGLIYHVEEASDRFLSRKSVSLMVEMFNRLQKLKLTDGETALVGAIITMSSDRCELDNPALVESTQLDLCNLLRQNMKDLYGEKNGSIRFTKIVDCLTTLRQVAVQYYKDYRSICEEKLVQKETPLFDILLPDNDV